MQAILPEDLPWMQQCLDLAKLAGSAVSPNPLVGALITLDNRLVAKGYHPACGSPHAEVYALEAWRTFLRQENLKENKAAEATLYVSLEPCNHHGRTPPCTEAILAAGIGTVVFACSDPHPLVQGRGIQRLLEAGVRVRGPVFEKEARWMNRRFETMVHQNRPYTVLKWARSADGYLDRGDGGPGPKITGGVSQQHTHRLRQEQAAILVGARTLVRDNPHLDARILGPPHPRVVVVGDERPWPQNLHVLQRDPPPLRLSWPKLPHSPVPSWHQTLLANGLHSVLVEGGFHTLNTFLQSSQWDEVHVLENPLLRWGQGTPAPIEPQNPIYNGKLGDDLYRVYLHPAWVPGQNAPDWDYLRDHFSSL